MNVCELLANAASVFANYYPVLLWQHNYDDKVRNSPQKTLLYIFMLYMVMCTKCIKSELIKGSSFVEAIFAISDFPL